MYSAADGTRDMMNNPMAGMMGGMPGAAQDFTKLYAAEKENLQLIDHVWIGQGIEDRVLALYN